MKKYFNSVVFLLVLFQINSTVLAYDLGDVDGDKDISSADASAIMLYTFDRVNNPLTEEQFIAADVDENGIVDSSDSAMIMLHTYDKVRNILGSNGVATQTTTETTTEITTEVTTETTTETTTEVTTETTTKDNHGENPTKDTTTESTTVSQTDKVRNELLNLVNNARKENGSVPLVLAKDVSEIAQIKAEDMADTGYFDHISPNYGSPYAMLVDAGIHYKTAGENIAKGYPTVEKVFNEWMQSPGHRQNILKETFEEIGIGYTNKTGTPHWVQIFVTRKK